MKINPLKLVVLALTVMVGTAPYVSNARNYKSPPKHKSSGMKPPAIAAMKFKNIEFGVNKAAVPAEAHASLDKVAKLMNENKASLKLGGYADKTGGYVYNWKLSKKRADAVKAYLVSKGSDSTHIASVEYGYTHPIASNSSANGRKKNRRVEIHFTE